MNPKAIVKASLSLARQGVNHIIQADGKIIVPKNKIKANSLTLSQKDANRAKKIISIFADCDDPHSVMQYIHTKTKDLTDFGDI